MYRLLLISELDLELCELSERISILLLFNARKVFIYNKTFTEPTLAIKYFLKITIVEIIIIFIELKIV